MSYKKKTHLSFPTLNALYKKHPDWPHHKELLELATKLNPKALLTSDGFRMLCTKLSIAKEEEVEESIHPQHTTYRLEPLIESKLLCKNTSHPVSTILTTGSNRFKQV